MANKNVEKADRASLVVKLWNSVSYQPRTTNCRGCTSSEGWGEGTGKGTCVLFDKLHFPVLQDGICKHHSAFKL